MKEIIEPVADGNVSDVNVDDKASIFSRVNTEHNVRLWQQSQPDALVEKMDQIANEIPAALVYNGVSYAVMMVTPFELEEFARGFSLTEGLIDQFSDIYDIDIMTHEQGTEIALTISNKCFLALKEKRRNLAGRTGCGICGIESLDQLQQAPQLRGTKLPVSHSAIDRATSSLTQFQPLQQSTGAVHGAAWCNLEGDIVRVCEDVGRHNALDKLIGALYADGDQTHLKEGRFQQGGFLLISSRASYEMIQKAAKADIAIVVAVSAPTSLAISTAEKVGISLVGFSRQGRHVVYAHSDRITH